DEEGDDGQIDDQHDRLEAQGARRLAVIEQPQLGAQGVDPAQRLLFTLRRGSRIWRHNRMPLESCRQAIRMDYLCRAIKGVRQGRSNLTLSLGGLAWLGGDERIRRLLRRGQQAGLGALDPEWSEKGRLDIGQGE